MGSIIYEIKFKGIEWGGSTYLNWLQPQVFGEDTEWKQMRHC